MKKFENPILITQSFLPPIEEYTQVLQSIWTSHWLTNQGPIHEEFRCRLRDYLKVKHVTLFVNGHSALDCAMRSLKLQGEVITTPFTFASTAHAITMNGLTPVFCDIKLNDYNMDEKKIEALITPKTSAILPVHVYGNPCNVRIIQDIAQAYGLKVIYDAAHAFGVEVDGKPIGAFGNVSMFSFHATKVFNTIEGGALTYNDPQYERRFDLHKNFGITGPDTVEALGLNAKMNEMQAAMGIVNLRYIEDEIARRKDIANTYKKYLSSVEGIFCLDEISGVKHNHAYFPILIDDKVFGSDRDQVYTRLCDYNVYTRKYFYPIVSEYECYRSMFNCDDTPVAKYVANRILALPMYGSLELGYVENICEIFYHLKKSV